MKETDWNNSYLHLPVFQQIAMEADKVDAVIEEAELLSVVVDEKSEEKPKTKTSARIKPKPAYRQFIITIVRHIIIFLVIYAVLFSTFNFCFDRYDQRSILESLAFCDDWKQMIFFLGIYISFAVKKVSDITTVSDFC